MMTQTDLQTITIDELYEQLWQAVNHMAITACLDPTKFGEAHQEIIRTIAEFLTLDMSVPDLEPTSPILEKRPRRVRRILNRLRRQRPSTAITPDTDDEPVDTSLAVSPIIICGEPGTGKTTFLYVIDAVLRREFGLPDNLLPTMTKGDAQTQSIQKRSFDNIQTSLLSVRKWTDLLRFYAWDTTIHKFNWPDLDRFVQQTLVPMRVVFADEVEVDGYSPTIPNIAKHGVLVIGTSNQYDFLQLREEGIPAQIYNFGGLDMRAGTPTDALVHENQAEWHYFDTLMKQPSHRHILFDYQYLAQEKVAFIRFDFEEGMKAPLLEIDWVHLLEAVYQTATNTTLGTGSPFIVLLDDFSLNVLQNNYDAVIRFIAFFDALEQIGLGVFLRHRSQPVTLSQTEIESLKTSIRTSTQVTEAIKRRVLVGIDRSTSRIGQAAHRAQGYLSA